MDTYKIYVTNKNGESKWIEIQGEKCLEKEFPDVRLFVAFYDKYSGSEVGWRVCEKTTGCCIYPAVMPEKWAAIALAKAKIENNYEDFQNRVKKILAARKQKPMIQQSLFDICC